MALSRVYDNANHQWLEISTGNSVSSVNGEVGHVVLDADDIDYSSGVSIKDKIDSNNSRISNPNFLDNWYFLNLVNQRGQTSYTLPTNGGYSFDRWKGNSANIIHEQVANGIKITPIAGWSFYQIIENAEQYIGKTVTVSAKVNAVNGTRFRLALSCRTAVSGGSEISGSIYSSDITATGIITATRVVPQNTVGMYFGIYVNSPTTGAYITLEAVKFEIGSSQTLAHQENGVWVLNEIPNYVNELNKCQRYYRFVNSSFAEAFLIQGSGLHIPLHADISQMRTTPSLDYAGRTLQIYSGTMDWATLTDPTIVKDGDRFSILCTPPAGYTDPRPYLVKGIPNLTADL